jgi:hypothetical protein
MASALAVPGRRGTCTSPVVVDDFGPGMRGTSEQPASTAWRNSRISGPATCRTIDVPAAPGCFPRLRPLPLPRASRLGGTFPSRSSADGGIEELPLSRPSRRLSSATSARSSSTARLSSPGNRPCSAITASRAAHPAHPAAGGSDPVTGHHDQDIPAVIKPTRSGRPCKVPAHQARGGMYPAMASLSPCPVFTSSRSSRRVARLPCVTGSQREPWAGLRWRGADDG